MFIWTGNTHKKPQLSVVELASVEITVGPDSHHSETRNSSSLHFLLHLFWKLHRRGQGLTSCNKSVEHK